METTKKKQHRKQLPTVWGKKEILIAHYSSVILKIPPEGIDVLRHAITGGDMKVTTKPV